MSDEQDSSDGAAAKPPEAQGGVFGNLPDARPGTRSPRRQSEATKAKPATKAKAKAPAKPKQKPKAAPKPKATPKPKTTPPPSPPREREQPAAQSAEEQGGLSDVAWAGIAVAAEAATLGVRLASRAIEAVRGNPERGNSERD